MSAHDARRGGHVLIVDLADLAGSRRRVQRCVAARVEEARRHEHDALRTLHRRKAAQVIAERVEQQPRAAGTLLLARVQRGAGDELAQRRDHALMVGREIDLDAAVRHRRVGDAIARTERIDVAHHRVDGVALGAGADRFVIHHDRDPARRRRRRVGRERTVEVRVGNRRRRVRLG